MIECRLARSMFCVHHDEFLRAGTEVIAIPKAGVVLKPVWCDLRFIDAAFLPAEPASPLLGSASSRLVAAVAVCGGSDRGISAAGKTPANSRETIPANARHTNEVERPKSVL